MPVGKKLKKYEWWFLVGLVIVLLATFSIAPTLRGCSEPQGDDRFAGSFQVAPNKREKVSAAEVSGLFRQYATAGGIYQSAFGPSLRWSGEWSGVVPEDRMQPVAATWAHLAEVRSAEEAGYRVGDEELRGFLRRLLGGTPSEETYGRVLAQLRVSSKAEFEKLIREILLRDKFLTPLVEGMRWSKGREDAYRDWKSSRERVDLAYAAVPADQFKEAVATEEATRSTLAEATSRLDDVVKATQAIRSLVPRAIEAKKDGALPADLEALRTALKGDLPKDSWKRDFTYRVDGDKPVFSSTGPDGTAGTADDVGPAVLDEVLSLSSLRQVGEALLVWRGSVKSWPQDLQKLTSPPPTDGGGRPLPAPLAALPKDAWGRDFVYDAAGPTLLSTGPDGNRGTPDDLVAEVDEKAVRVPVPAFFDAWRAADAKDAWGKPVRLQLASANPPRFEATSGGPDGTPGNDDDVRDGNASDLSAYYAGARGEFREPDRRAFESLYALLPLVPDDAMKKAWADFPAYRPNEEECFDRFRVNMVEEAAALGYYHVSDSVEVDGKPVTKNLDPADPEKGHGAALLAALKTAKAIPAETKGWLVPAPDVFGDQKDPPAPAAGAPPAADSATRTLYLDKGWRRILLREMFFERLCKDQLDQVRAAQASHKKWEADKKGDEPKVPTFQDLLARFRDYQPGDADRAAGARFLEYLSRDPLSREELEAIPELSDPLSSQDLRRLKEGDVSAIPVVIKGSCARVVFRCTKVVLSHEPELSAVRAKVWPKYLEHRAVERAAREAQRIQEEAQKKPAEGKPAPTLEEAAASVASARGFKVQTGTTGLFVGSSPPRSRPVPDDATAERKDEVRRRSYVRTAGYRWVAAPRTGQGQAPTSTKVGTFGRQVLRDEGEGEDSTRSAYLVQVREQRDPSPREFHARAYAEWLARKAYDRRGSGREQRREPPVRSRSGFVDVELARYLDDWESIRRLWDIKLDHPETVKRDAR